MQQNHFLGQVPNKVMFQDTGMPHLGLERSCFMSLILELKKSCFICKPTVQVWSPFTLTCSVPHNYSTFSKTGSTRENGHKLPVAPLRTLPKVRSGQVGPGRMRAGRLCGGGADLKYFDAQVKIPRTFFPPPPVAGAAESTILGLSRLPTSAV